MDATASTVHLHDTFNHLSFLCLSAGYGLVYVQAFSRFYFVGDEDLLEIVGNANEPAKVAQHLGKMFASLTALNMMPGD